MQHAGQIALPHFHSSGAWFAISSNIFHFPQRTDP
jgi:hypothetical protein